MQIGDIAAGLMCAEIKEGLIKCRHGQNSRNHSRNYNSALAPQLYVLAAAAGKPHLSSIHSAAIFSLQPPADIYR